MKIDEIRGRLAGLETSHLCDTDPELRVMDPGLRPVRTDLLLIGTAFTVTCENDFLTVVKGLRDAAPGDVLVVDTRGSRVAVAGEMFTTEAARRGLAGIVVDGSVRDLAGLRTIPIPVYSRTCSPRAGTSKTLFGTEIRIRCGEVLVDPGEVLFGDQDGIVVGSLAQMAAALSGAEAIRDREADALGRMQSGESLFDILDLEDRLRGTPDSGSPTLLKAPSIPAVED